MTTYNRSLEQANELIRKFLPSSQLKYGIIFTTLLPGWFVGAYLLSIKAPIPDVDTSTLILLTCVSLLFAVLVAFVTLTAFFPSLLYWHYSKSMTMLVNRRQSIFGIGSFDKRNFYIPTLICSPTLLTILSSAIFDVSDIAQIAVFFLFCVIFSIVGLLVLVSEKWSKNTRGLNSANYMSVFTSLFAIMVFSLIIIFTLFTILHAVLKDSFSVEDGSGYLSLAATFVIYTSVNLVFFAFRPLWNNLPIAMLMWIIPFVIAIPAKTGGFLLRSLGVGGGLPASIILKESSRKGDDALNQPIHGCLILTAGTQIVFSIAKSAAECQSKVERKNTTYNNLDDKIIVSKQNILLVGPFDSPFSNTK